MFTGLIEQLGEVAEFKPTSAGFRLRLTTDLASTLTPGESLAVNGVASPAQIVRVTGAHSKFYMHRESTLGGSTREETAAYLEANFSRPDADALLDDVYAKVGR